MTARRQQRRPTDATPTSINRPDLVKDADVDGRRPRRWPMSKEATFPVYRDPQTRYRKWQACATGPAAMQTVANKLWRLAPPSAVAASFAGCCCCCCPTCDVTGSASTTSCSAFTRFSARRTARSLCYRMAGGNQIKLSLSTAFPDSLLRTCRWRNVRCAVSKSPHSCPKQRA